MQFDAIVITGDKTEDFRSSFLKQFKNDVFDEHRLNSVKEALGLRVNETVSFLLTAIPEIHTLGDDDLLPRTGFDSRFAKRYKQLTIIHLNAARRAILLLNLS